MLIDTLATSFRRQIVQPNAWTLEKFLEACKNNPWLTAHPAARMLEAIGEEERLDTSQDPRLNRLFDGRTISVYPAFKDDFFGLEPAISKIVSYYRYAARGLETRKKILYLLGPPGTAKSALAQRLKRLYGTCTMFVLAVKRDEKDKDDDDPYILSPVFEHPLELFNQDEHGKHFGSHGIRPYQFGTGGPSPWAWGQLKHFGGNIDRFHVVEVPCSVGLQAGITRTEPGHTKLSVLIGERNRDGSYGYHGGLNRSTQGLMEFVEMFKSPPDLLKPLLAAMEEGFYEGDGKIGTFPYRGMVLAHSNQAEWEAFSNNAANAGFVDRMFKVEVPYSLRISQERRIYDRMIHNSGLSNAPCAPHTTHMLAAYAVLSRLPSYQGAKPTMTQVRVYDGDDPAEVGDGALPLAKYREALSADKEGMNAKSVSTRTGFTILSETFFQDPEEIGVDPLLLLERLELLAKGDEQRTTFVQKLYLFYLDLLDRNIKLAYVESAGGDSGQELFEQYCALALAWDSPDEEPYRPKDAPGSLPWTKEEVSAEIIKIEKKLNIGGDLKEFRSDLARDCLRKGRLMTWESHEKMRPIIDQWLKNGGEDMASVISFFGNQKTAELEKKHGRFVEALGKKGYSARQMKRQVKWYMEKKGMPLLAPD